MVVLLGFSLAANMLLGQFMWIEHRNFPGGPVAYFNDENTIWFNVLGSATDVVADYLSNALLIYRCYIIWNRQWKIIAFPCLVFLGASVMAMFTVVESALPLSSIFTEQSISFAIPWISLTCGLNTMITILIAGRIIYLSRAISGILPPENRRIYTNVVAIMVESALPFTLLGIIFAITLGKNIQESVAFSDIWGMFVALSPQFIILRLAMGKGWTDATVSEFSGSLSFSNAASTLPVASLSDKSDNELSDTSGTTRNPNLDSSVNLGASGTTVFTKDLEKGM